MSQETVKSYEPKRNFQKKVSYVDYSDSEDKDNMIGLVEWVKGKKQRQEDSVLSLWQERAREIPL
jgi:hypothetical protein